MTTTLTPLKLPPPYPDHTKLAESDGTFVKNFQEHPQSIILTDSIGPILAQLHPDEMYAIGQDCGIYWRETDPPEQGAEAPGWFYVPGVPPTLDGEFRRSYVLWREYRAPLIALEFASGDGSEERDATPLAWADTGEKVKPGKFWVYEQIIHIPFYGIYVIQEQKLEVYHLLEGCYQLLEANERGHYFIPPLGVELGLWEGKYQNQLQTWLRWWDREGNLLLTGDERAEQQQQRAEQQQQRAEQAEAAWEQERLRSQALAERLRAMGVEPESLF